MDEVVRAPAGSYRQLVPVAPSPGQVIGIERCAVRFQAGKDGRQERADVAAVVKAFGDAIDQSLIMRANVIAGCAKRGLLITVNVRRDDGAVMLAITPQNDSVVVDLGDIEKAAVYARGRCAECDLFARGLLTAILAHEMVHVRDGIENHRHMLARTQSVVCPAVDDENSVLAELGLAVRRENYAYFDSAGRMHTDFTVNGAQVSLNISDLLGS